MSWPKTIAYLLNRSVTDWVDGIHVTNASRVCVYKSDFPLMWESLAASIIYGTGRIEYYKQSWNLLHISIWSKSCPPARIFSRIISDHGPRRRLITLPATPSRLNSNTIHTCWWFENHFQMPNAWKVWFHLYTWILLLWAWSEIWCCPFKF